MEKNKIIKFKKRSPFLIVILTIFTLGIYPYYWFEKTNQGLKKLDKFAPFSSTAPIIFLINLFFVRGLYFFSEKYGNELLLLASMIIQLILIIWVFIYFYKYYKSAKNVLGNMSFWAYIILFIPFGFIYYQNKFNKYSN